MAQQENSHSENRIDRSSGPIHSDAQGVDPSIKSPGPHDVHPDGSRVVQGGSRQRVMMWHDS